MEQEKLNYKDTDGKTLYGYSQTSLDNNTFWIKLLVVAISLILAYILWLTYYVIKHNVLNNIVAHCIK